MLLTVLCPFVFAIILHSSNITASAAILQVPIHQLDEYCPYPPGYDRACEFQGPGLYRLINYGFQYAATINTSAPDAAVVSMPLDNTDWAQQWGIYYIDSSENVTMIYNRATGAALYAATSKKPVRTMYLPPYDKRAHWTMARDPFADVEGGPIVFINRAISGVLDLSATNENAGTPVLVYPKHNPAARNQGWYLQLMRLD